jgi:hypothetical protein
MMRLFCLSIRRLSCSGGSAAGLQRGRYPYTPALSSQNAHRTATVTPLGAQHERDRLSFTTVTTIFQRIMPDSVVVAIVPTALVAAAGTIHGAA